MSDAWRPLLTGQEAESALDAAGSIAADLKDRLARGSLVPEGGPPWRGYCLAGGEAGIALFFAYLSRVRPGEGHDDLALEMLDRAVGEAVDGQVWGLYTGFPGVAWALEHLGGSFFQGGDGEDLGEDAAASLLELLTGSWQDQYELISGLAGHGVYALERLPRPGGRDCLARVVELLGETADRYDEGISWHTPHEKIPATSRDRFPEGHFNMGVAHGVPGVLAALGGATAAGIPGARPLLDGVVSWLLAQRLPLGEASAFSYTVTPGRPKISSRLAWCYGDPGIAAALHATARAVGESGWEGEALAVARACARRPPETAGVIDAGLCHGASGLAHLFNRLHQASGAPDLAEAARYWYRQTLELRRPGEGIGGFQTWVGDALGGLGWENEPSFLTGAAGIGLALLAAAAPFEPAWDRLLLASLPPGVPAA